MRRARALKRLWILIPIALAIGLFAVRAAVHVDPRARLHAVAAEPADPPGATAGTGSIAVARGGPLVVGFQSDGPARLSIAGRELRGQGLIKDRIIVSAGALAIRFAGPPDARLVWSPVGRRGDPEYLPASSVSPEAPARATFVAAGRNPVDGVIALALLATLVGTLIVLARARIARISNASWIAMGAVFAVALIARLVDLDGFGQAWDEDTNWAAGRNYVTNVLALDFSDRSWTWNYEHPPVMKLLDGIGAQLADGFGPARVLSALWLSLGCAFMVAIGTRLYNRRVGVLAGLVAALLPSLVAHGQIVGHESPTVLWWSLGILLSVCAHDRLVADRGGRWALRLRLAAIGLVIGIAVASRFVNGLLGPLCVLIVLVQAPKGWRRTTLLGVPLMVAGTLLAFYAVWPRLWLDPIGALQISLAKLDVTHAPEPFLGAITSTPPQYYFAIYLAATLPVGVLCGVVLGLGRSLLEANRAAVITLAWLLIPLAIGLSPVKQDGVRYVMPCVLALVMLAAAGLEYVAGLVKRRHVFTGVAAALTVYLGLTLVRIHPYYLDYFGEQVGGPANVASRRWFETAWWGEGLDRAVAYVNAYAAPNATVHRDCVLPNHLTWFRHDLWASLVSDPKRAEWIVVYVSTARPCRIPSDARKVFEVDAQGAPLAAVYQRP